MIILKVQCFSVKNLLLILLVSLLFSCNDEVSKSIILDRNYPENQPVFLELDSSAGGLGGLQIRGNNFPEPVPLQHLGKNQWCFIPTVSLDKGELLSISPSDKKFDPPCEITQDSQFINVTIGDQLILGYAVATQFPADTLPGYYKRSGFIHPLNTLSGETLTAGFPKGHVHQHGIFHAWTRSHVRDSMIDFWNQQALLGDIRHKKVMDIKNGPVFSSFQVLLEYLAYIQDDTLVVSEEMWEIRIIPLNNEYIVDWHLDQKCLGPDSIILDEYHYGGAAFRGNEIWNIEEGAYDSLAFIKTSEGKSQIDGNHTRPPWVTMHGQTKYGYGGIAMFQHPDNFRYPQPIRIHPTMPYFCFAPMVLGQFVLNPGDTYTADFRFLVFDGKPNQDLISKYAAAYQD